MLSIKTISDAGYYLGGGSGCGIHAPGHEPGPADYQLDAVAGGEAPGKWGWRGENTLNLTGEIRSEGASGDAFRTLLNELKNPNTGRQLGRAPQTFKSPEQRLAAYVKKHPHATPEEVAAFRVKAAADQRQAANGFDLVFSAGKSWSVLDAAYRRAGRHGDAEALWEAVEAGVNAALTVLFEELGFVRNGASGPKVAGRSTTHFGRAQNLVLALWRHSVSREQDPQMHVHVTLINRVLTESGNWQALYSPAILKAKHGLDAVFTRVAEAEATRRLGISFAATPDGVSREIVGVPEEVRALFSSRSRALTEEAQELLDQYVATHDLEDAGKVPARVRWRLLQHATLKTRRAKPATPPSREEDLSRWEEEARSEVRRSLDEVLAEVDANTADTIEVPAWDPDVVIGQALADLEQSKATFNKSHLTFALSKRLPDMLAVEPAEVPKLLSELTERAIASPDVVGAEAKPVVPVPKSLRDTKTGRSVFEAPEGRRFTTRRHLKREDSLLARLDHRGAPAVSEAAADELLAEAGLFDEQQAAARRVLTSDHRLEVLDASAGTGKTRTLKAISDAAEEAFGFGVTGFALAQNAALVMAGEGIPRAHNVERYLNFLDREERGEVSEVERAKFAVPAGGIAAIDEAGMVDTERLSRLVAALHARDVKVVLVGDTQQLDAVDAGGAFAMLVGELEKRDREAAKTSPEGRALQAGEPAVDVAAWTGEGQPERVKVPVGPRLTRLTEVRRFANRWERDASAKLRDGESEALTQYDARGRIHGDSDPAKVDEIAVRGFVTDWLCGRDAVIVTGSGEKAADLSSQVHQRLVEAGHVAADGVVLRGHTIVSVGDVVATRENNRHIDVVNRERWQVVGTSRDGALEVRALLDRDEAGQQRYGEVKTLPAAYAQRQIELAYAGTAHATQGMTVRGSSWTVVDPMMTRSHAYVGASRGVESNHFVVQLDEVTPQRHNETDEQYAARLGQQTPLGRLAEVFGKDDHVQAARVEIAGEQARAAHLGHLTPQWEWVVRETRAASHREVLKAALGDDAERVLGDPASNKVFNQLRAAELSGHEPAEVVQAAMGGGSLVGARSPASVLYARIDDELATGPLGKPIPTSFESRVPRAQLGETENERLAFARATGRIMDDRAAVLAAEAAKETPEWAVRALGPVPTDEVARGGWIGRVALAAAYREAYGYNHPRDAIGRRPVHAEPERGWLWDTAARLIGMPDAERDLRGQSAGKLTNRVQDWDRTLAWMPRNVDADLREAHLARDEARYQWVQARVAGRDGLVELEADMLAVDEHVAKLEEIAAARAAAYEAKREVRERAEEARRELERRGEVERARAGVPLVVETEQSEPEVDEADVHTAVFDHYRQRHMPGLRTLFGSPRWAEMEDTDPAKQAAVTAAAMRWFNLGEPLDRDAAEVTARLEEHGLDVLPDEDLLTGRALARVREERVEPEEAMRDEPSADGGVLAAVFAWAGPHLEGDAPEFGSSRWAALDPAEPAREKAEARAALAWFGTGDDLDERRARADQADMRAASHAVAAAKTQEREDRRQEAVRERAEADRAERDRVAAWERGHAAGQATEPYEPNLSPEPVETKVEPEPEPVEPVVWPEVKTPPEPESAGDEPPGPVTVQVEAPQTPAESARNEPVEPVAVKVSPCKASPGSEPVRDTGETFAAESPRIDRSSYQWALDAAEQQRQADDAAQKAAEEQAQREQADAEQRDDKAARDADLARELDRAREVARELAAEKEPDPTPTSAPEPTRPVERELADD